MAFIIKVFNTFKKSKTSKSPVEQSGSKISTFNYKGFIFYYNNQGLRADLLKSGDWSYDQEIASSIIAELTESSSPIFLDIGAHAGFITLNILEKVSSVQVFAFEPGMLQSSLFEKTIKANNLNDKVILYKEALGRETGMTSFVCQESPDVDWSMNNGFLDTGRGKGKQKRVEVKVQTIDNWWKEAGQPKVNVVKMDTEGAELWILQGGTEFLSTCKPAIFLEINPLNLHVYPYGARDILVWLDNHNYYVKTLGGVQVTPDNLKRILKDNEFFVARPEAGLNNE